MEGATKVKKGRSSTKRFSLKGLTSKSSYTVLDEDPTNRRCGNSESSEANDNQDTGLEICQQIDSVITEDVKEDVENVEKCRRKHKRKFSLLKKNQTSTECLVIEDKSTEDGDVTRRHKKKFRLLKKKREHLSVERLVIEEQTDTIKENVNNDKKKNRKRAKNKYEKECPLTKEEKRKKKKKKTKRIKKAGRRAVKAIGNGLMQLGEAFRYMSPITGISDISPSNQNYYNVGYTTRNNTSYL